MFVLKNGLAGLGKPGTLAGVLVLGVISCMAVLAVYKLRATTTPGRETMRKPSHFFCNLFALKPAERKRHLELTGKLLAARKKTVEIEHGYEFQFSPVDVSLGELTEWVVAEGKCCPFFDFHLDVEQEGRLLCLRLTGMKGIKAFIGAEFGSQESGVRSQPESHGEK
jgi:hypothetical protein